MSLHDPFGHFKHKLWLKKGLGVNLSNCQFDSWPLKVRNHPNFFMWRWRVTYRWKYLDEGYNFVLDLISIRGLHAKLWGPKVVRVWIVGILGLPGQNVIWVLVLLPCTKYIIRVKVVASPKSGPWWVLWIRVRSWLVLASEVLQLCTNQLVVWFVQVRVSDWLLIIFPSLIPELQHVPLTPKCCEPGIMPQPLTLLLFSR
jgi:hypothetical protein